MVLRLVLVLLVLTVPAMAQLDRGFENEAEQASWSTPAPQLIAPPEPAPTKHKFTVASLEPFFMYGLVGMEQSIAFTHSLNMLNSPRTPVKATHQLEWNLCTQGSETLFTAEGAFTMIIGKLRKRKTPSAAQKLNNDITRSMISPVVVN